MEWRPYLDQVIEWLLNHGIRIGVILILMILALRVARVIASRLLLLFRHVAMDNEAKKRADTLSSLVRYALAFTIMGVSLVMVLSELGIQIGPVLAAAGIVGVAIGFGSQQLVQDVISGFFILMEDEIRVGDVVRIAGQGGQVEKINLRMTVLRDLSGNVHYVRNGQIDVVTNMTKEFSYYVFDIGVAYRENVDDVIEVVKQVGQQLQEDPDFSSDVLEALDVLGVDQFADSAVVIKARIKTKAIKQWRVGREFNRRLKLAFDKRGIEIPYPHLTVYAGQDKQGQAPPVRVAVEGAGS